MLQIDEDRPLLDAALDEYGLAPVAEKLAASVAKLASSDGVVFGIEGSWGSGKTTFINFLRDALRRVGDVHVVALSPWLMGDSRSLVSSLAEAIGPLLEPAEAGSPKRRWQNKGKRAVKVVDVMRGYAARTGRGIAPIAKLAGLVVPGASAVGDMLETGSTALESMQWGKTDEAIKSEITQRILESGAKFVVIIDDLDRLEPAQAVEVMRLIRSVADFPRIAYVLSYDRQVLAHALETGLVLTDGDLYMQKIVQLTFALPQPEPFDLRNSLRSKCLDLYRSVHGDEPPADDLEDLHRAIDREGGELRTPREVKLVLNNLAFTYPTIAEDIYFPDLCRVQLLKTLRPKLHNWIERYLGIRSLLVSGDAALHKADRTRLGDELAALLPDEDVGSTNSIWSLRDYVPGVVRTDVPENRVFQTTSSRQVTEMIERRRLGSPVHHRFYFALSGPKAMIPETGMEELREAAGRSLADVRQVLIGHIEKDRQVGRGWYEHLLIRLDEAALKKYTFNELSGLLLGFATTYDIAERKFGERQALMPSLADKVQLLANQTIARMRQVDAGRTSAAVALLYEQGGLAWLVAHFHRHHLFAHGLVGDRSKPEEQWVLTAEELTDGGKRLESRIAQDSQMLPLIQDFGSFVWGWRDLAGLEVVKTWITTQSKDDHLFLWILKSLRSWAVSDKVYYPLRRSTVEDFFDYDTTITRLETLKLTGSADAKADAEAITTSLEQATRLG